MATEKKLNIIAILELVIRILLLLISAGVISAKDAPKIGVKVIKEVKEDFA